MINNVPIDAIPEICVGMASSPYLPMGNELLDQAVRRWRVAQEMLIAELGEAEELHRKMKSLKDAAQRVLVREREMK